MQRNYYEILGVPVTATTDEIKARYRKLARWYHPDNYVDLDAGIRELAEQRMREVNEAYTVLSDATKRARYDQTMGLSRTTVVVSEKRSFQSWDEARIEGIFASAEEMRRYTGFAYGLQEAGPRQMAQQRASRITLPRLPAWHRASKQARKLLAVFGPALAAWATAIVLIVIAIGIAALAVALLIKSLLHPALSSGILAAMLMFLAAILLIGAALGSVPDD